MGDTGSLILLVVVLVLVVAMFVVSYVKKKKYNTELGTMRQELKIGDKVMTDTGVVGEVVDSYEEEGYKYFVLKSGRGNNVGCFAVHANAIYYVFGKEQQTEQVKENKGATPAKNVETAENEVEEQEKQKTTKPKTTNSKTAKSKSTKKKTK